MNVCMLAYAHYLNDARIKCYVRTLEDHGDSVDVIALRAKNESAAEAGRSGTIFRIMDKYQGGSALLYAWSYLVFCIRATLVLARRSFSHRYDVIHVHNMPNVLVFAAIAPKLLGAKVMLDVHDLMPVNYMAKFSAGENTLPVRALKLEQKLSSMFANCVFCADHNQKDFLVEQCGIPERKITVLMNLPNTALFGSTPARKGTRSGVFRIVYHGTIAHRLGIDLILHAMARVVDQVSAEMWIHGAGDYLPEALALSSRLGLDGKVHFSRSFFAVEKIPEMVSAMDLGIIGNRRNLACDRYMLPVKLLEYVYLGIPVVAPRLQVIGRYFDESMVRYYEPEDVDDMANAILSLAGNPQECDHQAQAALRFYERNNIAEQGQRYLSLLTASHHGRYTASERYT